MTRSSEPMFNVPSAIVATVALLTLIHLLRAYVLPDDVDSLMVFTLAFDPARYGDGMLAGADVPGGFGAKIWTFVTYALIHGNWMHLGFNVLWLLPFGSAVARRFGNLRFFAFFAVTAAAGALAHLAAHYGENLPVIGASAAVSGMMAAAMRFVFQRGGPVQMMQQSSGGYHVPALTLGRALRDRRIVIFLAVWFGLNLLFGMSSISGAIGSGGAPVAWQAHIGGFLAGLLLFGVFDPVPADAPATHPTQH